MIKSVTKYACNNPMSVCRRNWRECVCANGDIIENVNVIYNEWYESVNVDKMDIVSVSAKWYDRCKGWVGFLCYFKHRKLYN